MTISARLANSSNRFRIGAALGLTLAAGATVVTLSAGPASALDSVPAVEHLEKVGTPVEAPGGSDKVGTPIEETTGSDKVGTPIEDAELAEDGAVFFPQSAPGDTDPATADQEEAATAGITEADVEALRQSEAAYTQCMRAHGIEIADSVITLTEDALIAEAGAIDPSVDPQGEAFTNASFDCTGGNEGAHELPKFDV